MERNNYLPFYFLLGLFSLSMNSTVAAQEGTENEIAVKNGSFEDVPHAGGSRSFGIKEWFDCGGVDFPRESPPDIHPKDFWENVTPPSHGESYLGMVARDNDSWESVSQRLGSPMEVGKCYTLSIDLCRSDRYVSKSQMTKKVANFTTPIVLRVWGGPGYCNTKQLLAESMPINHANWKSYEFNFEATYANRHITLEAFYKTPVPIPYNGHLLIDNLSNFSIIECPEQPFSGIAYPKKEDEPVIAAVNVIPPHKRKKPKKKKPKKEFKENEAIADASVSTKPQWKKKIKILKDLDKRTIKKGQIINIENLYFTADKAKIEKASFPVLEEVYEFLKSNRGIFVEIGGHTNNQPSVEYCDQLSSNRAKSVAEYLSDRGIASNRVKYRGYGKREPKYSNSTKIGRQKNQRVEIKILSING